MQYVCKFYKQPYFLPSLFLSSPSTIPSFTLKSTIFINKTHKIITFKPTKVYSTSTAELVNDGNNSKNGGNNDKDTFFANDTVSWSSLGVSDQLSQSLSNAGFVKPSLIQICEPPVSVYKGYSLHSEAEEHLVSHGLQNALYTIKASDLNDDLFGTLVPCPFQEPAASTGETSSIPQKRPPDAIASGNLQTCVLEFNGASRGNPGPAGAGAVLRTLNGSVICKIRQGLGRATYNVADYQALILGLKRALEMGYTSIRAKGDNELVCMQLQGLWKVKKQNMAVLHAEASKLKKKFTSFQISHVLQELNTDADKQANLGVALANGQIQEKLGLHSSFDQDF